LYSDTDPPAPEPLALLEALEVLEVLEPLMPPPPALLALCADVPPDPPDSPPPPHEEPARPRIPAASTFRKRSFMERSYSNMRHPAPALCQRAPRARPKIALEGPSGLVYALLETHP
jgi:hypothetical protein